MKHSEVEKMRHTFRLPALDADVVIDVDTVTITNNEGETIQVSADEWEMLRKKWRFDDIVDSKDGGIAHDRLSIPYFCGTDPPNQKPRSGERTLEG